jgi:serine/threonine-protein kinase
MSEFVIPGFELIEKVGEGGMGQVWKARQVSLDRLVAIKMLPPRLSHDTESIKQILKEARTAARLKHHGIVHMYDVCEHDGQTFLVMEFVEGYNVGQWLARKKVLSYKDALAVIESVSVALKYAWRETGLIHCDLKPENIMVDIDGTVKVADLGLSLTRESKNEMLQEGDEITGTPGYISPEQEQGLAPLDCRTDIYSLGCCLYQMVSGVRPFQNLSDSDAMQAQVTSQIPDPRDFVPEIPASVCGLIEWMLIKDSAHRLADWDAVLKELHRAMKSPMSTREAAPEGASTMRRRHQVVTPVPGIQPEVKTSTGMRMAMIVGIGAFIATIQLAGIWWFSREKAPESPISAPKLIVTVPTNAPTVAPAPLEVPVAPVPKVAPSPDKAIARAIQGIRKEVDSYIDAGKLEEGIKWLEAYGGKWAEETLAIRKELADILRAKKAARDEATAGETAWSTLQEAMISCVLSGKYPVASQLVDGALKEGKLKKHLAEVTLLKGNLEDICALPDAVLQTFASSIGNELSIQLVRGLFQGHLTAIRDRKLIMKTMDQSAQVDIKFDEISPAERQSRLIALNLPQGFLVRGVAAYNAGKMDEADVLWANSRTLLGTMLIERRKADQVAAARASAMSSVRAGEEKEMRADPSFVAFAKLVKGAGIDLEECDLEKMRKSIEQAPIKREAALISDRGMDAFLVTHGTSPFADKHADLILAFQSACDRALR